MEISTIHNFPADDRSKALERMALSFESSGNFSQAAEILENLNVEVIFRMFSIF